MAYKNKYMMMEDSTETDSVGNNYPDLATFPINDFKPQSKGRPFIMKETDVYRFDISIYDYYSAYDFYDNITLWLNDIPYLSNDDYIGYEMLFYQKREINQFFINSLVG